MYNRQKYTSYESQMSLCKVSLCIVIIACPFKCVIKYNDVKTILREENERHMAREFQIINF